MRVVGENGYLREGYLFGGEEFDSVDVMEVFVIVFEGSEYNVFEVKF